MDEVANTAVAVSVVMATVGMLSLRPPWLGAAPAGDLPPGDDHVEELDAFCKQQDPDDAEGSAAR